MTSVETATIVIIPAIIILFFVLGGSEKTDTSKSGTKGK
jgi:hypothetical protein